MIRARNLAIIILIALNCVACPGPKPPTPTPVFVTVQICSASGLVATERCPADQVQARKYLSGTQPTALCDVHKAPETRVAAPWRPGGELRAWSGGLYGLLAGTFVDEAKLDALYEAMAVDGVNGERNFAWFAAIEDGWVGAYLLPWNADWSWNEAYWEQVDRRLKMWCGDRDGTEIISILDACSMYAGDSWEVNPLNKLVTTPAEVFSAGPARDKVVAFARELARRTAKYAPRIIYEAINEGAQLVGFDALQTYDRAIIAALKAEGVPVTRIAVGWFDSSMFYDLILNDLEGKGLAFTHQVNSEKSADWYRDSPGKKGLAALGDRPSSDGPDFYPDEPKGLLWFWLPGGQGRRASDAQIAYVMAVMRGIGYPGYEFLSASGFQHGLLPNLDEAITIGRPERLAMKGN